MKTFLGAFILVSVIASAMAQAPSGKRSAVSGTKKAAANVDPAAAAAKEGLQILRASITKDNFKQFGFAKLEDVGKMEVGAGVPVFYVRADQLKDYTPGTDAGKLMINTNRRVYPVTVDGIGRLIMTIENKGQGWRLVSFGQQDIAASLAKIREDKINHSSGPGTSPQNYFAVEIPSMQLSFLAYAPPPGPGGSVETKRQVSLTALNSRESMKQSIGFKNSNFLSLNPYFTPQNEGAKTANDVFKALAPQAAAVSNTTAPR